MTKEQEKPQNNAWQHVQIARRPDRPHTLDYVRQLCTDFVELHGDRHYGDDAAIVGGPASFEGRTVMIIGHQKGTTTKENLARNFAQAMPEGYRKALRLMRHAEKFGMPLLTFIDTPGANPGIESEERGQAQAIADNLLAMLTLEVPIISVVIGEGGSGGALAIGVADRILMLENSIYSVASPEASAAILWHDAGQARTAAEAMKITAQDLLGFGIADEIIPEPAGGAHTDSDATIENTRAVILRNLTELEDTYSHRGKLGLRRMLEGRQHKYKSIGTYHEETIAHIEQLPAPEVAAQPQYQAAWNGKNGMTSHAGDADQDVTSELVTEEPAAETSAPERSGRGAKAKRKPE